MTDIKGSFTTGSECVAKAGSGYNTSFNYYLGSVIRQAEGTINVTARYDLSTAGSLDLIGSAWKPFLSDICSSLVAIQAITYDINSYTTRITAEDMINVQRDNALRGLTILKEIKVQEAMGLK